MIVRNWMNPTPITVSSDMLVSKAKRILVEQNVRAVPVVDNGRLRGVVTRVNCLRVAELVTRTEDPFEFDYLINRLKVKDIMVRSPRTVDIDDSIGCCLRRGREERVGQFPVMNGDKVAGLVSASEVMNLAVELIGAMRDLSSISIGPMTIEPGTLPDIAQRVAATGATLDAIFTVARKEDADGRRVVVNFSGAPTQAVIDAATAAGYRVFEASEPARVKVKSAVNKSTQ